MPSLLLSLHERLCLNDLSFISENQHVLRGVKRTEGKKNHAFHLWIHLKINAGLVILTIFAWKMSSPGATWASCFSKCCSLVLNAAECLTSAPFFLRLITDLYVLPTKIFFFPFISASTVSVALENFYLRLFFLLCILALELLLFLWAIKCMATKSTEIFWEEEALLILNSHILCQQLAFYFQRTRQYKNK